MKILFIGGNGNISWYCVQRAIEHGHEVYELNRSMTLRTRRAIQPKVHKLTADIRDLNEVREVLGEEKFDVVADFICYHEQDAKDAVELFRERTKCFVFISSDAVYKRDTCNLPFRENCTKLNADEIEDAYISGKIRAEQYFIDEFEKNGFPVTIVRPSHTYDTIVPVAIGQNCFTAPQKFLDGKPALIGGDGMALRSITHSRDFATAFVLLIENRSTLGQDFHIATQIWVTWNDAMKTLFRVLGITKYSSLHIPYEDALHIDAFQTGEIARQKMWHTIFDLSKLRSYIGDWKAEVSLEEGLKETVAWLKGDSVRQRIIPKYSDALDALYQKYGGSKGA